MKGGGGGGNTGGGGKFLLKGKCRGGGCNTRKVMLKGMLSGGMQDPWGKKIRWKIGDKFKVKITKIKTNIFFKFMVERSKHKSIYA